MSTPTCAEIMEALPGRFNTEAAKDWNAVVQFQLSGDDGGEYTLTVKDGNATVAQGSTDEASATVIVSADNWVGMITGSANPMQLFMTGQLQVKGNIADVMKLNDPNVFVRE